MEQKKEPPPSKSAPIQSLRTDCLQDVVFFKSRNIKEDSSGQEEYDTDTSDYSGKYNIKSDGPVQGQAIGDHANIHMYFIYFSSGQNEPELSRQSSSNGNDYSQVSHYQESKEEELSQVPVPLDNLGAKKDYISDNPQNSCYDASDDVSDALSHFNVQQKHIFSFDNWLHSLKKLADIHKPLGWCLSICTVNILSLSITIVGLITGNYWLLIAVVLPMLKLLL